VATDEHGPAWLGTHLLPEVLADDRTRKPFAQLMNLDAILLGLALERLGSGGRRVRVAETVLTTLHGASQLAAAAPGFLEPFSVVRACERLAGLDLSDWWPTPTIVAEARAVDERWSPPDAVDLVRGTPVRLDGDGVVTVLGLHRLSAAEDAVRAAPPTLPVTAVLVTADVAELAPLARLAIAELTVPLRQAFPEAAWPRLRLVCDESGDLASAVGVSAVSDATETTVHVRSGRIVSRADGFGAGHSAASTPAPRVRNR
jgi:hypothetical protein